MTNQTEQRLTAIADQMGIEGIKPDDSVKGIGDSLDLIDFAFRVEREFGLDIPDRQWEDFKTVRDVANYLDRHARPENRSENKAA